VFIGIAKCRPPQSGNSLPENRELQTRAMSSSAKIKSVIMVVVLPSLGVKMKAPITQLVIIACSLTFLASCSKINLHNGGNAKGGAPAGKNAAANGAHPQQGGGQPAQQSNAPPLLDGEWEVDYEFKGDQFVGTVNFAQSGAAVTGAGADQDGKEWQVDNGQVQGTKVSFGKKYANSQSPPIVYTGELKFLQTADYTGWMMEGTYTAAGPGGSAVSGKWVANPSAPPVQEAAPSAEQAAPSPASGGGFFGANNPAAPSAPRSSEPEHIGDARPVDISGHYDGSYNFNFKKVKSKMWIENDGEKISGRGYDVLSNSAPPKPKPKGKGKEKEKPVDQGGGKENFVIEHGTYKYPNVTLTRQYVKGKGANETRTVVFRAKLSSNGRDIVMKGETQFGGTWDSHRL